MTTITKQSIEFVELQSSTPTKKSYEKALRDFVHYLIEHESLNITVNTLREYQEYLSDQDYSTRTKTTRLHALMSFFKTYYPAFAVIDELKFHLSKQRELSSKYISNSQFYHHLHRAKNVFGYDLEKYFRYMVIVRLLMETGLSAHEMVDLKYNFYDQKRGRLNLPHRKYSEAQQLPISTVLALEMSTYQLLMKQSGGYLIGDSRYGEKITVRSLERIISAVSQDEFSARDLKYTFMLNQIFKGKSIRETGRMVGGFSASTENYLSDKRDELIRTKKVNVYKPRMAANDVWLLHVLDVIGKRYNIDRLLSKNDFSTDLPIKYPQLKRLLTKVFKFPHERRDEDEYFFIHDDELVKKLRNYYSLDS